MNRLSAIAGLFRLGRRIRALAPAQRESEGLGLQLAKAADGAEDEGGFGTAREGGGRMTGQGADAMVVGRQDGPETGGGSPGGFGFGDSCKVLRPDADFLEEEIKLGVAVWWRQDAALGHRAGMAESQKVSIVQIHPLAVGHAEGIDVCT